MDHRDVGQARRRDTPDQRALLVGAGGAGSAIALALLDGGVAQLAVHDTDGAKREALIARLDSVHAGKVLAGSASPLGFDIIVNATPMGMPREARYRSRSTHSRPPHSSVTSLRCRRSRHCSRRHGRGDVARKPASACSRVRSN